MSPGASIETSRKGQPSPCRCFVWSGPIACIINGAETCDDYYSGIEFTASETIVFGTMGGGIKTDYGLTWVFEGGYPMLPQEVDDFSLAMEGDKLVFVLTNTIFSSSSTYTFECADE